MDLHESSLCLECRPSAQPAFEWEEAKAKFDPTFYLEPGASQKAVYQTALGALYGDDCLKVLPAILECSIDTVFADPPFNLGKQYRNGTNDALCEAEYVRWCKNWIDECIRVLKPGGALFLYNLPKWNVIFGNYLLERGMDFRHWIAIELNLALPIPKRLYPSHYSLLYYTKGPPAFTILFELQYRRAATAVAKSKTAAGIGIR